MSKIRVALIEDHDPRVGIRTALQQRQEIEVVVRQLMPMMDWNIETSHPDIAIVDIGLPDKDGIELTRQIKSAQEDGARINTKVLILTLRDNKEAVLAAFAAGQTLIAWKISFDNLLEALRVTHGGNAWLTRQSLALYCNKRNKVQKYSRQRLIQNVAINAADVEYDQMIAAYLDRTRIRSLATHCWRL